MSLINESDRQSVQIKYKNESTILNCRIPRIQTTNLPQSSTQCLIDVTIKGEPLQDRTRYLEHLVAQELAKCIQKQAYSGCSIKIILFILNAGQKLFQGLINCTVATLLLCGVAMKKTLYAIESSGNLIVMNLINGNVVSSTLQSPINFQQIQVTRSKYTQYLKQWLSSEMRL